MIEIKVDDNGVKIHGKGGTTEILADFIAVYCVLAVSIAQKLKISPKNGLLHLYQLAAEYMTKNPIEKEEKENE